MRSGIMRITVTVVVIMFELTGALTYILPTMVSHHVTDSARLTPLSDRRSGHKGCRGLPRYEWYC